ncbi:alpha-1,2-fucosyltransferase [Aquipseudomonas alcaligenes]|uniref:alpha-1,2-fucosyltransferase n=1 Tax=Aquipseudomonas alcaligenes TaxID=43263 RepID=UPI003749810C
MIIVGLQGGLGNQLFQYAAGRALSEAWDLPLTLDTKWFDAVIGMPGVTPRTYALAPFGLDARTQSVGLPISYSGRIWRLINPLSTLLGRMTSAPRVVQEQSFRFAADAFGEKGPVWLSGYWQSWRYFDSIASRLRTELATPGTLSQQSEQVLAQIRTASAAVCLHIRRGDYVTNPGAASFHGTCSVTYYEDALRSMHFDSEPTCFVFSDDLDWARENLRLPYPAVWVDANGPDDAHQDLWLMAACRHFVIANSSLSWWGAWLGCAPDKQVVAPKQWFTDASRDTSDLLCPEWKQL